MVLHDICLHYTMLLQQLSLVIITETSLLDNRSAQVTQEIQFSHQALGLHKRSSSVIKRWGYTRDPVQSSSAGVTQEIQFSHNIVIRRSVTHEIQFSHNIVIRRSVTHEIQFSHHIAIRPHLRQQYNTCMSIPLSLLHTYYTQRTCIHN